MKYLTFFLFLFIAPIVHAQSAFITQTGYSIETCSDGYVGALVLPIGSIHYPPDTCTDADVADEPTMDAVTKVPHPLTPAQIQQQAQALLQTAEAWDFDHDAQLEASGVNWTNIQNLYPLADFTDIQTWANITCPVAENTVNWSNFRHCVAKGLKPYSNSCTGTGFTNCWGAFYCGKGSVSGVC